MAVSALRLALIAFALGCAVSGCELVADFDRDKIPVPPRDASTFDDAGNPSRDSGTPSDGATPDDDGGATPPDEEDAGG